MALLWSTYRLLYSVDLLTKSLHLCQVTFGIVEDFSVNWKWIAKLRRLLLDSFEKSLKSFLVFVLYCALKLPFKLFDIFHIHQELLSFLDVFRFNYCLLSLFNSSLQLIYISLILPD